MNEEMLRKNAIKSLMVNEHDGSKNLDCPDTLRCVVCEKTYVHEKSLINHIVNNHENSIAEEEAVIAERGRIRNIEYTTESIDDTINYVIKSFQDKKEKFAEDILNNPENALRWAAEDLVKQQQKAQTMMVIKEWKERIIEEHPETWRLDLLDALNDLRESTIDRIVFNPVKHNSSNFMTNMVELVRREADCELFREGFADSVSSIIYDLEKLKELKNEKGVSDEI